MFWTKAISWCIAGYCALQGAQAGAIDSQHPLGSGCLLQQGGCFSEAPSDSLDFTPGAYTKKQQDGRVCVSNGEKQWTGTVDVSSTKRLFYWFFESRGDPENDPVLIWMNGGPGASSMMGMLTEMGPCFLDAESLTTRPNPHSWSNNASVLFIDQPAGTGLSFLAPGEPLPTTDAEGAVDFEYFLNVWFGSAFPELKDHPIHMAGESYGGHFVGRYTHHIFESRAHNSRDAFWGNISSVILVNAYSDAVVGSIGLYELLCTDFRGHLLDEKACTTMAQALPECVKLGDMCRLTEDLQVCAAAFQYCSDNMAVYYNREVDAGRRSPYDIHLPCHNHPLCLDITVGNQTAFINQPWVLENLGFSPSFNFELVNLAINGARIQNGDFFRSMARYFAYLLDEAPANDGRGLRVLVLNGNEDAIVNTAGQKWLFDNVAWSGLGEYKAVPWRSWSDGASADASDAVQLPFAGSGFWKQADHGRFAFVAVDGAGHEAPRNQGEATWQIMHEWLQGWDV